MNKNEMKKFIRGKFAAALEFACKDETGRTFGRDFGLNEKDQLLAARIWKSEYDRVLRKIQE